MALRKLYILLFVFFISEAVFSDPCVFKPGNYRLGQLFLNDSTTLEFYIREGKNPKSGKVSWIILNADEEILVHDFKQEGDTLMIRMPVFSSYFRVYHPAGKPLSEKLSGFWVNENRSSMNRIRFRADRVQLKPVATLEEHGFEGTWATTFSPGTADATPAIGKFYNPHCWDRIYGTFLTETGDYRFLSGKVYYESGKTYMQIGCFDGTHAFLFKARLTSDSTLEGNFYSGMHHTEPFIARRGLEASLRDPGSIIKVIHPELPVQFAYYSTEGTYISSKQLLGKPAVIQLMGSWCPNCMDESKSLEKFRKRFGTDIHFIALAFEKTTDTAAARPRLERFRTKLGCHYPFLLTGLTGKDAASKLFPMLSGIEAFPTTIYMDANGKVIYTTSGYNGPATGSAHTDWELHTERLLKSLLQH